MRPDRLHPEVFVGRIGPRAIVGLLALLAGWGHLDAGEISFRNDVLPVLSKAGCNMGLCHGNQNGKGGFKLSLRGEDPEWDYAALTRDLSNRRTNSIDPDASLALMKPLMQVPHEGGRRFAADSLEHRILREWIAQGARSDLERAPRLAALDVEPLAAVLVEPAEGVQLRARARFGDGSSRDVTSLAVYEPVEPIVIVDHEGRVSRAGFGETTVVVRFLEQQIPVRIAFVAARPDFVWNAPAPANFIDEAVFAKLKELRIAPAPLCSDTEFLRRATLDLLGRIPTADEARRFAADDSAEKRPRLIEQLLQRPEFADVWALKWADLLRNEEKTLDTKGVEAFQAWIRHCIASNKPMDAFARELIASRGSTYSSPAANYYRAMREPLMRAESTAQLFLGVRLQCAKCHNHPFDRWTQNDYYSWANLFARVDYKILDNNRRDKNDGHEFDGEQIVFMANKGEVPHPRTGEALPPRFLADGSTPLSANADRLEALAEWVGNARNEQFARTQANRIWYQLMGRGVVEPIDDFRATNPPSNPALLDALTHEFVRSGFDLQALIRLIMNSRTYQLSSSANESNRSDESHFSHAAVRRLSSEQLLDSLSSALAVPVEFTDFPLGTRAAELPGVKTQVMRVREKTLGDQFLIAFGKPARLQTCECERSNETTLSQTFQLLSGPLIQELLAASKNRIAQLMEKPNDEAVAELFWSMLSRAPTTAEREKFIGYLHDHANRRQALEDIAWALATSNEFMLRH
ncbi:MAG TPA: DUF1549 and DUF1553 domain-containing protein [Planctomycetaceae bacterium]|nr:DUF1549 and DUF1553 domain-containing protein [Planctomycetaceae bacterium]